VTDVIGSSSDLHITTMRTFLLLSLAATAESFALTHSQGTRIHRSSALEARNGLLQEIQKASLVAALVFATATAPALADGA